MNLTIHKSKEEETNKNFEMLNQHLEEMRNVLFTDTSGKIKTDDIKNVAEGQPFLSKQTNGKVYVFGKYNGIIYNLVTGDPI